MITSILSKFFPPKGEEWRQVVSFDRYEVSSFGNIRSKEEMFTGKNGRAYRVRARTVTQTVDRYGYCYVRLNRPGRVRKFQQVHRLVALAFKPCGDPTQEVNHKNLNKRDNRLLNLEWMTGQQNREHARLMRLMLAEEMAKAA